LFRLDVAGDLAANRPLQEQIVAKRLRYSRWRRLPGVYRIGERKPLDPALEEERLTLYLPAGLIEKAEAMGLRSGAATVQDYCARLLREAIQSEHAREQVEELEAKRGPLEGFDAIANDPNYLAEWKASRSPREPTSATSEVHFPESESEPAPEPAAGSAIAVVLRHAAIRDDDPSSFLATLRRGESIPPASAQELLAALVELEASFRDIPRLDRQLAYALHRLAFEGQVLLTDAYPGAAVDPATVDVLRLVQEAVDRVLSGEDIRYYRQGP
jgi:hypothetical protein